MALIITVAIALNDEHQDFVAKAVKSGRYLSESAVIAEALSKLEEREVFLVDDADSLRAKLQVTAEDVKRDGRERMAGQSAHR